MEPDDLMRQWRTSVRISHRAHADAAARCERLHVRLGLPALVLASGLGTTILASLESTPARSTKALAGLAAVAVAVLIALQTFLGHTARGQRHQQAALRYSQIQRELDELLALTDGAPKRSKRLDELRERWSEIDLMAPAITARQHNQARDLVLGTREK